MFHFRDALDLDPGHPRVEVAFTDGSLDLQGLKPTFAAALAAVETEAGVSFARLHQVHGEEVVTVDEAWPRGPLEHVPMADALVTERPGVGLMIRVADCVPILLVGSGTDGPVIGAVHAGRKGVALDITTRTVERMRALGASSLRAWVGPHVCGGCYEVPAQMRDEVAAVVAQAKAETSWGTPSLDLGAGVEAQLRAAGVEVTRVPGCTLHDEGLHSYRRDGGRSGRIAGLVWMR